jgi:hypothetical protein
MKRDDDWDSEPKRGWRGYAGYAALGLVFLGAAYGVYSLVNSGDSPKRKVIEVMALKMVPPPPPPPPKEEPPPPPKVVEQKIEPPPTPDDQPKNDAPPPDAPLALDAAGSGGGDAFGLGAKPGGTPLQLGQTIGGGGNGFNFGRYASLMQNQISRHIRQDEKLNTAKFRATIRVWLTNAGKVDRVQVLRTSGDTQLDKLIEQELGTMPAMPETPPREMPQPVIVRIGALPGVG